ncbi:MAG: aminotransferase class I/II-fold pyridoxal phosphate-dependent enzyme [bacterium]|nr:aminotransferase class I/II-fold pyridoxal phosphate-dependent enzyme [bacterium]
MRIDTFKIEDWMNRYCPTAQYDLTTSCIKPLTIRELMTLSGICRPLEIFDIDLSYGDIHGSERLRTAIKSLYEGQDYENITVTHGAIGGNQLVFESLLDKGDEVITFVPTYQQLYSLPKALGANVKSIHLREENNWQPNLKELEDTLTCKTKLICLNNPNNPTGAVISDEILVRIANIAKAHNIWILCDEAYRGLNHQGNNYSQSIADIYEKGISIGSMSKTYSLPGLRLGWIVCRSDLRNEIIKHREYNTISISLIDDYYATIALENRKKIEARNFQIIQNGLRVLNDWLNEEVYIKTNFPQGGTTALLRYKKDISSCYLCEKFYCETGIAILPGATMDIEGTVRIGYCVNSDMLNSCLKAFSKFLRKLKN